ncbi:MAG: cell division protein FtsQ [Armatimonadetes bacterium]|nr:cell division protein FtsQ [Armatimonadota bacterium]
MNRQPPHARDQRFAAARRERRERNRKKPDILGALRVVVALLLIAQSIRVAFTSPRLRLHDVRVTGTQRLAPPDVQRLGGVPMGQNVFRCNLVRVSEQIRRDPVIKDVVVTRELPATLHVAIRERVPALQVMSGAQRFDADDEGFVFRRAEALTKGLPLLQLPEKDLPGVGQSLAAPTLKAVQECARLAGTQGLQLRNLRVDGAGDLWLNVEISPKNPAAPPMLAVRLGRPTDLPEKFRDIRQVLLGVPDLTAKGSFLNVMCAGSPSYMTDSETTKTN